MAYSLMIAEDEQLTRNGLTKFIPWAELGFEVSAVFSDGREVLAYLKQEIADVLLMDIKMVQVSGLEVAKFVFENKLPVKIILLSGHKSFEYAQQAVEYNVEHYLLKPVSVPKLRQVFGDLRDKLDAESTMEDALQYRMDKYQRLVNDQKQQFALEVLLGTLNTPEEINRRLELLGGRGQACLIFQTSLCHDEACRNFLREYGAQELMEQIVHLFQTFDERMDFYPAENTNDKLTGLFWEKGSSRCIRLYRSGEHSMEDLLVQLVREMTGLTIEITEAVCFESPEQLVNYRKPAAPAKDMPVKDEEFLHHLREQKKLLISYLLQGGFLEGQRLAEAFVRECLPFGVPFTQNQLMHFFSLAVDKISDGDTMMFTRLLYKVNLLEISALSGEEELIRWSAQTVRAVSDFVDQQRPGDCITKLKRYIRGHYAKDITLSDAAEQVYLNPIYISRIFKERTGWTFTEYLAQVRIDAAVELLDNSNQYVYEICESVGYHNLKYFYKVFKKIKGCSPSDYRRRKADRPQTAEQTQAPEPAQTPEGEG